MIQTFKTIKQIDNVGPATLFTLSSSHHQNATRNSAVILDNSVVPSTNLFKPAARLELCRNFFSNRVITPWNNLPPHVKSAQTVNQFKARYDAHQGKF